MNQDDQIDQELKIWAPDQEPKKDTTPVPISDSLVKRFLDWTKQQGQGDEKQSDQFFKTIRDAWGNDPVGMTPETIKTFQGAGVFNKPGEVNPLKALTYGYDQTVTGAADLLMKGLNAGTAGLTELTGQMVDDMFSPVAKPGNPDTPGQMTRELSNYWMTVGGIAHGMEIIRPNVDAHGTPIQEPLGTVPTIGEDFNTAAKALGDKQLKADIQKLYQDKGVLPQEVVHDASTDPSIMQDFAKGDTPKSYGGNFPLELNQQVEQFQKSKKILATNEIYPEQAPVYQYVPMDVSKDLTGTVVYHGTKSSLEKLSEADVYSNSSVWNLYGEGLYTTDSPVMGENYAKNKGVGPKGKVLSAELGNVNLIDLDKPLPDNAKSVFEKLIKKLTGDHSDEDSEWITNLLNSPAKDVYTNIKQGMASNDYHLGDAIDEYNGLNQELSKLGYDGLRHTGGEKITTKHGPHNVVILFEDKSIDKAGNEVGRMLKNKLKDVPYKPINPERTVPETSMSGSFTQEPLKNTPITETPEGTAMQMPGGTWLATDKDFKINYTGNSPASKRMTELVKGQATGSEDFPHLNEGGGGAGEPPNGGIGVRNGFPELPGPKGGLPALPDKGIPLSEKTIKELQSEILSNVSIGKSDWKQPMSLDRLYYNVFDDIHPVKVAEARAIADIKKRQGVNWDWSEHGTTSSYEDFRLTRGSFGRADQFMKYGTYDFHTYTNDGKSFEQIIEPFKKDLNGLRTFIVSKRAIELDNRGIETGFNIEAAKRLANDPVEKQLYDGVQRELVDYHNKLARYLRDSGTISRRLYDSIVSANKEFIPFNRYLDTSLHPITGTKYSVGRRLGSKNPLQKISGSELAVIDPLESIIKNTYHYIALAEKNAAGRKLVDLLKEADKGIKSATQISPVPKRGIGDNGGPPLLAIEDGTVAKAGEKVLEGEILPPETSLEADKKASQYIQGQVEEAGGLPTETQRELEEISEASPQDETADFVDALWETVAPEVHDGTVTVTGNNRKTYGDTIAVFENGKKTTYRVTDPDLLRAWRGLDQYTANWLVRTLAGPASLLRAGATITPEFIIKNLGRDFLSAFINTNKGLFNPIDTVKGAIEYGRKGETYQNWLKGGGANGTMVSLDRKYLQESLLQLNKNTGFMNGVWNTVRPMDAKSLNPLTWSVNPKFGFLKPFSAMRTVSEYAENATRLGAFMKETGKSPNKGLMKLGAYTSREATLDFARIGASMRGMNLITAFFSPSLQGVDRLVRAFQKNPLGTTIRVLAGITAPSVLLWEHNVQDPRWKELPMWQKNLFWMYLTPNGGPIIRIPKPFEAGIIFGSGPERALDYMYAHDRHAFDGFFGSAAESLTPSVVPTFATPLVEQAGNFSMFTGEPLIPGRLENVLPEYQYQSYTSDTAKTIAKFFSAIPGARSAALGGNAVANAFTSPIILENYIKDWTGGTGQYLLTLADKSLQNSGVVPKPVNPTEKAWSDILFVRSFLVRYPSSSARSIQDFYTREGENEKIMNTMQQAADAGNLQMYGEVQKNFGIRQDLTGIKQTLTDQAHLVSSIDQNPKMTPQDKRQQIDSIYSNMIKLAQSGVQMLDKLDDARNGN